MRKKSDKEFEELFHFLYHCYNVDFKALEVFHGILKLYFSKDMSKEDKEYLFW